MVHRTRRYVGAMKEAFRRGGYFESRKELNLFVKNINKGFQKYGRKTRMKIDFATPSRDPMMPSRKVVLAYFRFEKVK